MHFSFAYKSLPTYIALTVSTMLRGGVKINGCSLTLSDSILTLSSAICFERVIID